MKRPSYPTSCRSLYCGETTCPPDCSNLPALVAYHQAQADWLRERMEQAEPEPEPDQWAALEAEIASIEHETRELEQKAEVLKDRIRAWADKQAEADAEAGALSRAQALEEEPQDHPQIGHLEPIESPGWRGWE